MKVIVIYKGGIENEEIECEEYFAHISNGWMFVKKDESRVFISSSDVRKIFTIKE